MKDIPLEAQVIIGIGIAITILLLIVFGSTKFNSYIGKVNILEKQESIKDLQITQIPGQISLSIKKDITTKGIKELLVQALQSEEYYIEDQDIETIQEAIKTYLYSDLKVVAFKLGGQNNKYSSFSVIRCNIRNINPVDKTCVMTDSAEVAIEIYSIKYPGSSNISHTNLKELILQGVNSYLSKEVESPITPPHSF